MQIERIIVGNLQVNCYVVACAETGAAMIIDPGAEGEIILAKLKERQWQAKLIVNTHGHSDHIGANCFLQEATGAPVLIHNADYSMLSDPLLNLSYYLGQQPSCPQDVHTIEEGTELQIGKLTFKVIHTPGHTPGGICLLCNNYLFAGDTLFAAGKGRTDLPGGNHVQLNASIKQKLLKLPETTKVYPGHGPFTTIGEEKRNFIY